MRDNDKSGEQASLGRAVARAPGAICGKVLDVVGQLAMQEGAGVFAADDEQSELG